MKLARVIIVAFAVCAFIGVTAHAATIKDQLSLYQFKNLYPAETVMICASSYSTHLNTNDLDWALRRKDTKLVHEKHMPANCRRYYASAITGWDRIRVTYHYKGDKYIAESIIKVIPAPKNPG